MNQIGLREIHVHPRVPGIQGACRHHAKRPCLLPGISASESAVRVRANLTLQQTWSPLRHG
jgi:hypothetical protein